MAIYAFAVEPAWLRVRHRVLYPEGWPRSLSGLRILHLSDLHIGRSSNRIARFLRATDGIDVDVVAITGDFVDKPADTRDIPSVFTGLWEGVPVLGVLGNHDRYAYSKPWLGARGRPWEGSALIDALRLAGVELLRDEKTTVTLRGGKGVATFVGADLTSELTTALKGVVAGAEDSRAVILMTHSPDVFAEACGLGVPLVLCGHTHGGQIRLGPWFAPTTSTKIPLKPHYGMIAAGSTLMHVSPGLGTTLLPFRFFARPEATILELRSSSDDI